jgi:outer membrane protein assembly factor BamB
MNRFLLTPCVLLISTACLQAGDWPMWRHDAARSAAAPDDIADKPVLLWSRQLPPVNPAWPLEPNQRIDFDASYEPIAVGKRLFLGSPNDGSVTAYHTETGEKLWTFYTEGPVRCAPACDKGRVYAGSDDGYLYCLDAQTGALVWKFRGAPPDRPDRRQLGNGHLVSFWPVRGGPVVQDNVVYFAAGIWPIFGVFIHALDADTARVKWTNRDLGYIDDARWVPEASLSPQGSLGLIGNRLVVPSGRALPAVLDADTGRLIQYSPGSRKGECRIALHGDYAYVGEHALLDVKTGLEVVTRKASEYLHYKLVPACNASSAFDQGVAYGAMNGVFYAYDVGRVKAGERDIEAGGQVQRNVYRWEPPLRWQFKTSHPQPAKAWKGVNRPGNYGYISGDVSKAGMTIKAGGRIYGSAGTNLICLKDLAGPPSLAWEHALSGVPTSLMVADDKLFVMTSGGTLHAFGAGLPGKAHDGTPVVLDTPGGPWADRARAVIQASGVKSGYCLVLGVEDGGLIGELLKQTELIVLAVDPDVARINALKARFDKAGLLGARIQLFTADPAGFLFPPYLASLIVSEKPFPSDPTGTMDMQRLFHTLRPYGGTLCVTRSAQEQTVLESALQKANLAKAVLRREGNLALLIREGSLPGAAAWSHMGCDAENTFCSKDDRVRAPLGFLWYGDVPTGQPGGWHSIISMAVNGGHVFQANANTILAYDAYTGRFLWTNSISARQRFSAMAAMPDGLYFAIDDQCLILAPETGGIAKTFKLGITASQMAVDLRILDNHVLVVCRDVKDPSRGPYYRSMSEIGSLLLCLDRTTGAELWRREAKDRFHGHALAMGAGQVFCVDTLPTAMAEKACGGRTNLKEIVSTLLALDARTGKLMWSDTIPYDATRTFSREEYASQVEDLHVPRIEADDWLAYSAETELVLAGRFLRGSAWAATSGKQMWSQKDIRGSAPLILRDRTLVTSGGDVHDVLTGERIHNYKSIRKRSCNYAIAGKHLIFIRGASESPATCSAGYYDVTQDKAYRLLNIRPSCRNNQLAADGILSSPCYTSGDCICNYSIQTSFALVTMPEVTGWAGTNAPSVTPPPSKPGPAKKQP